MKKSPFVKEMTDSFELAELADTVSKISGKAVTSIKKKSKGLAEEIYLWMPTLAK